MKYRAYNPSGDVVSEGALDADGKATFSHDNVVAKVVFYVGDGDAETVAGDVEVNSSGNISVPAPAAE